MNTKPQNENLIHIQTDNNITNNSENDYLYIGVGVIVFSLMGRCCQLFLCNNEDIEQQILDARLDYDYFV